MNKTFKGGSTPKFFLIYLDNIFSDFSLENSTQQPTHNNVTGSCADTNTSNDDDRQRQIMIVQAYFVEPYLVRRKICSYKLYIWSGTTNSFCIVIHNKLYQKWLSELHSVATSNNQENYPVIKLYHVIGKTWVTWEKVKRVAQPYFCCFKHFYP